MRVEPGRHEDQLGPELAHPRKDRLLPSRGETPRRPMRGASGTFRIVPCGPGLVRGPRPGPERRLMRRGETARAARPPADPACRCRDARRNPRPRRGPAHDDPAACFAAAATVPEQAKPHRRLALGMVTRAGARPRTRCAASPPSTRSTPRSAPPTARCARPQACRATSMYPRRAARSRSRVPRRGSRRDGIADAPAADRPRRPAGAVTRSGPCRRARPEPAPAGRPVRGGRAASMRKAVFMGDHCGGHAACPPCRATQSGISEIVQCRLKPASGPVRSVAQG